MTTHTRGSLKVECLSEPQRVIVVVSGTNIAMTVGGNDDVNARLLAAAFTSYDKHCGANAVECAEGDLLGEALEICRLVVESFRNKEDCGCSICKMQNNAKAVLAKAKANNQPPTQETKR